MKNRKISKYQIFDILIYHKKEKGFSENHFTYGLLELSFEWYNLKFISKKWFLRKKSTKGASRNFHCHNIKFDAIRLTGRFEVKISENLVKISWSVAKILLKNRMKIYLWTRVYMYMYHENEKKHFQNILSHRVFRIIYGMI